MSTPFPDVMQPPTLEPSAAAALVRHGGTVVCLNVPAGTRVGLDYAEWAVGPKFVGMKMLPPGPHFLWYRYGYPAPSIA
jgi:A1 cistron-splicing factor AAR2